MWLWVYAFWVSGNKEAWFEARELQKMFGVIEMKWRFDCFVCGERWELEHRNIEERNFMFSDKKEGRPMVDDDCKDVPLKPIFVKPLHLRASLLFIDAWLQLVLFFILLFLVVDVSCCCFVYFIFILCPKCI